MDYIYLLKECFPDKYIMYDSRYDALFKARNLPEFVRNYVLRKCMNQDGIVDPEAINKQLTINMPPPKEIEERLTLLYNHARQNQITTELTDIINGSNAVN